MSGIKALLFNLPAVALLTEVTKALSFTCVVSPVLIVPTLGFLVLGGSACFPTTLAP
jgi:hypothetical protein